MSDLDPRYAAIGDYALIGDCHGAALVRKDGSIDWACLTRFDSGAVFCRLLDADKGGTFAIRPRALVAVKRRYVPNTNVLETTLTTATGRVRLVDCFAMRTGGRQRPLRQLLRLVECIEGAVELDVMIQPRFDYGSLHPWLRYHPRERVHSAVGGDDALVLSTDCALELDQAEVAWRGHLSLGKRQRARFALSSARPYDIELRRVSARVFDSRLTQTMSWWRRWVDQGSRSVGTLAPEVVRSALVLKLLTCAPTGAIIAAPTTSLPEEVGGSRNWDYRYSWVRDSTMTLAALFAVGHPEVATGFKRFIESATAGRADELQIMYGCYGERRLTEVELDHLDGYRHSRPVRVGNGAATQTQLDVYGCLLDAAHLWIRTDNVLTPDGWRFLRGLVEMARMRWSEPDRGLWEIRSEPQHFVYSKVMCWLAVHRGIQIAEEQSLPCDLDDWKATRDLIRKSIEANGVDDERGCFVQAYGSKELDASLLRLPIVGFVEAADPRMRATIAAIREDLAVGPLIRRYRPDRSADGVSGGEGSFLMASFWLVDVLTMAGEIGDAEALYRELLELANDVGLLSEEYDPRTRELLGNFPQAFTHISLITAAEQIRRFREGDGDGRSLAERPQATKPQRSTIHHSPTPLRRKGKSRPR